MNARQSFWIRPTAIVIGLIGIFLLNQAHAQTVVNFNVIQPPQLEAKFSIDYKADRVTFVFWDSSTTTVSDWFWDFGDSTTSTLQNVSHVYAQKGIYNVCLAVKNNDNCRDTTCMEVNSFLGIKNEDFVGQSLRVAPNPFENDLKIQFEVMESSRVTVKLFNLVGEEVAVIANGVYEPGEVKLDYNTSNATRQFGVYFLRLEVNGHILTEKIIRN